MNVLPSAQNKSLYPIELGDNPDYPRKNDYQLKEINFLKGLGIISLRSFKKGEMVAQIKGKISENIHKRSIQLEEDKHLVDHYFLGYFKHSCEPNLKFNTKEQKVYANKNIEPNDFLSVNYIITEDYLFKQFQCDCKSKKCNGWITGKKEKPTKNSII